ncbi:hypothetical protein [Rhizobacter sp. Root1221]|uniref:hypothetical protein n=1 Tax=Rhizobacter sp. Root1221 TaxID=1736433 RepID=UPI0012F90650|nr:hypothetical protein [Rhizobacter sp. Root1221]
MKASAEFSAFGGSVATEARGGMRSRLPGAPTGTPNNQGFGELKPLEFKAVPPAPVGAAVKIDLINISYKN